MTEPVIPDDIPHALTDIYERGWYAAEATAERYRDALVKVQANFNVAHKRAIERGDGVGTQWLNVEFLVRDALATPEGGEQ